MENKINGDDFQNPFVFNTDWKNAFEDEEFIKVFSSDILENYIINKRWYGGKASTLKYIEVVDSFKINSKNNTYFGVLLEVNFKEAFFAECLTTFVACWIYRSFADIDLTIASLFRT